MDATLAKLRWHARARLRSALPAVERHFGLIAGFCAFEIAYYFAYRSGMDFGSQTASPFWLPDPILLCALLRSRPRNWWIFLLAPLPIRLFSGVAQGNPLWFLFGAYCVDTAKGLVTAAILRRVLANPIRLETIRDFAWFGLIAVLVVPAAAAFAGAELRSLRGADFWMSWQQWFIGDAVAQLVATPAILYWVFAKPWQMKLPASSRIFEAAFLASAIILTNYFVFQYNDQLPHLAASSSYLPVPFLFWAALRFGMVGASAAVAIITFCGVKTALSSSGPFSSEGPAGVALVLQNFLLLRAVPLYLVGASVDQRQAVESALRDSEARFRAMANTAPVFLWTTGLDKGCDFVNQSWVAFTGKSLEQTLGTGWAEPLHADDRNRIWNLYSSGFDARRPVEMEYRLRHHSGEYHWVLAKGVPRYNSAGEFLGYIGSAVDISERKLAEESNRAVAHIQRLAIMGELTAAIAHEVRQPLSAIRTNADTAELLLASANPPLEEVRAILTSIQKDDLRANDVLSRIRDFSRKREPEMGQLDIDAVVREAVRFVGAEAIRRRVEIHLDLANDLPPVFGDQVQLQQVLLNLIVNGMDAMEGIRPAERRLTLHTCQGSDDTIEISVVDCGIGIAATDLPHLFDTFFTTRPEGMGLGLSIAWSIIVGHHGRIWAENNDPAGGATFHVSLPAMRQPA